jgi:hypothetical protein
VIERNLQTYRLLTVQNKAHNDCFSPILWPMSQYAMMQMHVCLNIVLIKAGAWNFPVQFLLMIGAVILMVTSFEKKCFKGAARMFELSSEFKWELKQAHDKYVKRIEKAMRPLRIDVSCCYHIQMSTYTTYMRSVVEYTVDFLLTFGI